LRHRYATGATYGHSQYHGTNQHDYAIESLDQFTSSSGCRENRSLSRAVRSFLRSLTLHKFSARSESSSPELVFRNGSCASTGMGCMVKQGECVMLLTAVALVAIAVLNKTTLTGPPYARQKAITMPPAVISEPPT
jgi:hypothetical protein